MSFTEQPIEREKWLIQTLHAQKSHFRDAAPPPPDNMENIPSGHGVIVQCKDGRQQEFTDRRLGRGEAYIDRHLGTLIRPDRELEPTMIRALLPQDGDNAPRFANVTGHKTCGANAALLTAIVNPIALREEQMPEVAFMEPMMNGVKSLKEALRQAHKRGVDFGALREALTQSTALYSTQQLYARNLNGHNVPDLVNGDALHLTTNIRGMKEVNGRFPLATFDASPDHLAFRPIEALYDELFGSNAPRTEQAIKDRMKDMGADPLLFGQGARVSMGHKSRAGFIDTIRAGQQKIVDGIYAAR